jgi:ATP-dependent RNA circularization protein (DNA/RNA ligase family)
MKKIVPKFPEVFRIPVGKQGLIGRHVMSEADVNRLLSDEVVIEEKLDGKTLGTAFIEGYIIYGEFLKWKHSIRYDKLPSWIVGFDVLDLKTKSFLNRERKESILTEFSIPIAPLIFKGRVKSKEDLTKFLKRNSAFSTNSNIEGIVVKNYSKQIMGKIVTYEFITGIEKHWMKQKREMNRLDVLSLKASDLAMNPYYWEYA